LFGRLASDLFLGGVHRTPLYPQRSSVCQRFGRSTHICRERTTALRSHLRASTARPLMPGQGMTRRGMRSYSRMRRVRWWRKHQQSRHHGGQLHCDRRVMAHCLTISTTAAPNTALGSPMRPGGRSYTAGGAVVACVWLFGIPTSCPRHPEDATLAGFDRSVGVWGRGVRPRMGNVRVMNLACV
jgi:hypothetical protein